MFGFFQRLFDPSGFPARWNCGKWTDFHGWVYILSNVAIWSAYFAIPLLLVYFINKRKELPFRKLFWLFIAFILFCGLTHLTDSIIFWYPLYRFNAVLLVLTAVTSWSTVFALYKVLPVALSYKGPEELEEIIREKTRELERTNKNLSENEEQFKGLVNNNPDIILKINQELKIVFVNNSLEKITGISPDLVLGKRLDELGYTEIESAILIQNIETAFRAGKTVKYESGSLWTKESQGRFEETIVPIFEGDDNNEIHYVLVISRDITVQKITEVELNQTINDLQLLSQKIIQKNRQLENFSHILSHNLRSPIGNLNALLGFYEEERTAEGKELLVQHFSQSAQKLNETIGDLMEALKARQNTDVESINLAFADILNGILADISAQVLHTKAEISVDFTKCPEIVYPKVYLDSIILNLLTNSIKYSSPERIPRIYLETMMDGDKKVLICKDNGQGINMERNGHKLFGLYKTFHRNPDAKGVGLFLTKNQVEAMGGVIQVESEVNIGTTFTIIFNNLPKNEHN